MSWCLPVVVDGCSGAVSAWGLVPPPAVSTRVLVLCLIRRSRCCTLTSVCLLQLSLTCTILKQRHTHSSLPIPHNTTQYHTIPTKDLFHTSECLYMFAMCVCRAVTSRFPQNVITTIKPYFIRYVRNEPMQAFIINCYLSCLPISAQGICWLNPLNI